MRSSGGGHTLVLLFALLCFATNLAATTYYVSASGNDANSGTATTAAWKSVAKMSTKSFLAGDQILFEAGKVFTGKISFDAADKGATNNTIVVSSYGNGRATIDGGVSSGLFAYNVASLVISNLNFVGAGAAVNTGDGILFYADLPGGVKLSSITIDNVDVSGFGKAGLSIGAWNGTTAYRNVRITNVSLHDNLQAGLSIYAEAANANENIYVGHCFAFRNFGNPNATGNTGNGIVLGDVNGAVIERCVAYENGKNNFAPTEGPAGIWCYDSTNVVIQFNESFRNQTGSAADGDGFDLDINVKNSVLQYNYSHDNHGAGFLLCAGPSNDGNVIRYNISQNDGRKNGYGSIHVFGNVSNARIYNNTIFLSPATGGPRAFYLSSPTTNVRVLNNIFQTTGGARLLQIATGQSGLIFNGNDYFTSSGAFSILYNGANYSSFTSWQSASGQEEIGGTNVGWNLDPKLLNPGTGQSFTNADALPGLSTYTLAGDSPLLDRGRDISSLAGLNGHDYFGNAVPFGSGFDIGAHERGSGTPIQWVVPIRIGNQLQFSVTSPIGSTNRVEVTSDFARWDLLTNVVNTAGTVSFLDFVTTSKSKFYRVRVL